MKELQESCYTKIDPCGIPKVISDHAMNCKNSYFLQLEGLRVDNFLSKMFGSQKLSYPIKRFGEIIKKSRAYATTTQGKMQFFYHYSQTWLCTMSFSNPKLKISKYFVTIVIWLWIRLSKTLVSNSYCNWNFFNTCFF